MDMQDILNLSDDLDIATADPSEYAEAQPQQSGGAFAPIPDATYSGKLLSAEFDKDKAGALRTPRTPVLLLNVAIEGPAFNNRRLNFTRVYSKTYNRRGVQVSGLSDLLMSINAHDIPTENREKFMAVNRAVEQGTTVRFSTKTRAFDKKYFEDQGGQHLTKGTDAYKALQKKSTIVGFGRFTTTADGRLTCTGPSGEQIEGRAEVDTWLPSTGA